MSGTLAQKIAGKLTGALIATSLLALSGNASASFVRWSCWANPDLTIHCVLDDASRVARRDDPERELIVNRLPHLNAAARLIRLEPGRLVGVTVSIPLYAPPSDMDFAKELAESVMCGMRLACSVKLLNTPPGPAGNVFVAKS